MRIEPDADHAARDLVRELWVVAGGNPDAADREADHLRLAEHPVLPEGGGERAATEDASSCRRKLSIRRIEGISRSLAVRRLRHSSSSRPSTMTLALGRWRRSRWRRPLAWRRCRAPASRPCAAASGPRSSAGRRAAAGARAHGRARPRSRTGTRRAGHRAAASARPRSVAASGRSGTRGRAKLCAGS